MSRAVLVVTGSDGTEHTVTARQVVKMSGPLNAWTFVCSCGRESNGWHDTPMKAVEAGRGHVH